jgi:hypothetical protein
VPTYLIETYLARADGHERVARERRAHRAATELTAEGTPVRFAGALHIPDDEVSFITFEAATAGVAELAAQRAGLDPLRVATAVVSDPDRPNQPPQQENQ